MHVRTSTTVKVPPLVEETRVPLLGVQNATVLREPLKLTIFRVAFRWIPVEGTGSFSESGVCYGPLS